MQQVGQLAVSSTAWPAALGKPPKHKHLGIQPVRPCCARSVNSSGRSSSDQRIPTCALSPTSCRPSGRSEQQQECLAQPESHPTPPLLPGSPAGHFVDGIACGMHHVLAVARPLDRKHARPSDHGPTVVFAWGRGGEGQLGTGEAPGRSRGAWCGKSGAAAAAGMGAAACCGLVWGWAGRACMGQDGGPAPLS